ncbi:hypothetical protein [Vibrio parahaemolyticus]|uniref:hypothetical protein n=1 Tax=Vibrio parahaemolyticus TaxID=670 RepID=UPI000C9A33F2|nr:hypothetical protein [Vibrio parahaemolyticus]PMS91913.1 hypothetical protein C1T06_22725 [Vibrio parahaemolyticus]
MANTVQYKGEYISIYRLGQLTNTPLTSLYRAQKKGLTDGRDIVTEAKKHLIKHNGEFVTMSQLVKKSKSSQGALKRRIGAGMTSNEAVNDRIDRRGGRTKSAKLSPTQVLGIYHAVFYKLKTQTLIAHEYGVHPSTVCDIWRGKRWGWLTSPFRHALEQSHSHH